MSIATEITALNTNLTAAKNAVTAKGGTVGNTGLAGLATEIASIPSGGGGPSEWGRLWFYPFTKGWVVNNNDNCEAEITNEEDFTQQLLSQFQTSAGSIISMEIEWQGNGDEWIARANGGEEEIVVYSSDFEGYGLSIIIEDESQGYAICGLEFQTTVESDEDPMCLELSETFYNLINVTDSENNPLNGLISAQSVYKFEFGTEPISVPDSFLMETSLVDIDFTYAESLTSIGAGVCIGCHSLNPTRPMDLSSITSIGPHFLSNCTSFNQNIIFGNTTINCNGFLSGCHSLNTSITFPSTVTFILESNRMSQTFYNCYNMVAPIVFEVAPPNNLLEGAFAFSTDSDQVDQYTTGMTFGGTYAAQWKAIFPDRTTRPFRKINLAS